MAASSPLPRSQHNTPSPLFSSYPSQNTYLDSLHEEDAVRFSGLVRIRDERNEQHQESVINNNDNNNNNSSNNNRFITLDEKRNTVHDAIQSQPNRQTDMARFTSESLHSYQFSPSVTPHLLQIRKNILWRSLEFMKLKLTPSSPSSSPADSRIDQEESGKDEKWKSIKDSPEQLKDKTKFIINATSELEISDSDCSAKTDQQQSESDCEGTLNLSDDPQEDPSRSPQHTGVSTDPRTSRSRSIDPSTLSSESKANPRVHGPITIQTENLPSSRAYESAEGSGGVENYLNSAGVPHSALHSPQRFSARVQVFLSTDKHGKILLTNDMAYLTFGYEGSELVGRNILDLIAPSYCEKLRRRLSSKVEGMEGGEDDEKHADDVIYCGKVLGICVKGGSFGTASLWLKTKMAPNGMLTYMWVFQDIAESRASIDLSREGKIIATSGSFSEIFGVSPTVATGTSITTLIPSFEAHLSECGPSGKSKIELERRLSPWSIREGEKVSARKYVTLKSSGPSHLPSFIRARSDLSFDSDQEGATRSSDEDAKRYTVDVVALAFIGGMIVVTKDGSIVSGNGACLKRLLGYTKDDFRSKIKNLAQLIPQFPKLLELVQRENVSTTSTNKKKKNMGGSPTTATTTPSTYRSPIHGTSFWRKQNNLNPSSITEERGQSPVSSTDRSADKTSVGRPAVPSSSLDSPSPSPSPTPTLPPSLGDIVAVHKDGNPIKITVQIREVSQASGTVYAVWLTYDQNDKSGPDAAEEAQKDDKDVAEELISKEKPSPSPPPKPKPIPDDHDDDKEKDDGKDGLSGGHKDGLKDQPVKTVRIARSEHTAVPADEHPAPSEPEKAPRSIDGYQLLDTMGEGAYGFARLAVRKSDPTSKKKVLKFIVKGRILVESWTKDPGIGVVPMEIGILYRLSKNPHPNIVEMTHFFSDAVHYYIEMDLFGFGMDLFDYIEVKKDDLPEADIKRIFLQTCSAVEHLHKHGIVHRDIKDENLIIDGQGHVRLIDFGSSAYVKAGKPFEIFCGTLDYAAPEILHGFKYAGKQQDVWALGILLYTLIYKENPFYNIDEIVAGSLRLPFVLSDESVRLIKKTLNRDIDKRPTVEEIVNDAWFDGVKEELDFLSLSTTTAAS